ncbi:hypothetical protein Fmac_020197 [Flemingia macrophylla]|uniref:Ionotropic glutamate receptor C-terminal domain-containing protein n=1 Tax=Flemingia macrophylla TaxID=520843 RepID=A0ABD1LTD9_9FABA
MVVWLFVALIITQTYTASLASMLTVERLEPTVDSIQQLKKANSMVGYDTGSYCERYLQEALGMKATNIKPFDSQESYADALRNKEIAAVFVDVPGAKLFLAKHCKGFVIAGPTYKIGGYGFVFPRGSPLLPSVNQALLNISENGTLRELENIMLAAEECEDKIDQDGETTSISPASFLHWWRLRKNLIWIWYVSPLFLSLVDVYEDSDTELSPYPRVPRALVAGKGTLSPLWRCGGSLGRILRRIEEGRKHLWERSETRRVVELGGVLGGIHSVSPTFHQVVFRARFSKIRPIKYHGLGPLIPRISGPSS